MARVFTQPPPVYSDPQAFAPHQYQTYRNPRRGQQATLDAMGRYAQLYKNVAPIANLAVNLGQKIAWSRDADAPEAAAQPEQGVEAQVANEDLRQAADRALRAERRDSEEALPPAVIHGADSEAPFMDPSGDRYQAQAQGDMERADPRSVGRFINRQKWQRDHVGGLELEQMRLDADQLDAINEAQKRDAEEAQWRPSAQSSPDSAIRLGMGGLDDSAAIRQAAARQMGLKPLDLPRQRPFMPGEDVGGYMATAREIADLPLESKYDAERSMAEAKASQRTGGIVTPSAPAPTPPAEQRIQALSDAELKKARDYAVMVAQRPDARPEVMQKADAALKLLDAEIARRTGGNAQGATTGQPAPETPAVAAPAAPAQAKRDLSKYAPRQLESVHDNLQTQLLQMGADDPQRAQLQALADEVGAELAGRRQHEIATFIPQGRMTMPQAFALARTADTAEKQAAVLRALEKVNVPVNDWSDLITGDHQKRAAAEIAQYFPAQAKKSPEELASIIARNYGSAARAQAAAATDEALRPGKVDELPARSAMERANAEAAAANARKANRQADEIGVLSPKDAAMMEDTLALMRARAKAARAAAIRAGRSGSKDDFLKHEKALLETADKSRKEVNERFKTPIEDVEKALRPLEDDRRALLGKTGEMPLPVAPAKNADTAEIVNYNNKLSAALEHNTQARSAREALEKVEADRAILLAKSEKLRKARDEALQEVEEATKETVRLAAGVNRKVIERRGAKEGAVPQKGGTPSAPEIAPLVINGKPIPEGAEYESNGKTYKNVGGKPQRIK